MHQQGPPRQAGIGDDVNEREFAQARRRALRSQERLLRELLTAVTAEVAAIDRYLGAECGAFGATVVVAVLPHQAGDVTTSIDAAGK